MSYSPSFLCLWDISLKLATRSLSWASVPTFQEQESWDFLFSWCELVHIYGSCWSWKLHSCQVEVTFVSSSFSFMTNFPSKVYGLSKILFYFEKCGFFSNWHSIKFWLVEIFYNLKHCGLVIFLYGFSIWNCCLFVFWWYCEIFFVVSSA